MISWQNSQAIQMSATPTLLCSMSEEYWVRESLQTQHSGCSEAENRVQMNGGGSDTASGLSWWEGTEWWASRVIHGSNDVLRAWYCNKCRIKGCSNIEIYPRYKMYLILRCYALCWIVMERWILVKWYSEFELQQGLHHSLTLRQLITSVVFDRHWSSTLTPMIWLVPEGLWCMEKRSVWSMR